MLNPLGFQSDDSMAFCPIGLSNFEMTIYGVSVREKLIQLSNVPFIIGGIMSKFNSTINAFLSRGQMGNARNKLQYGYEFPINQLAEPL